LSSVLDMNDQNSSQPMEEQDEEHLSSSSSNAAWIRQTTLGAKASMLRHGFGNDIERITKDDQPLMVFRPQSKTPPNKFGLGFHPDQPLYPPIYARAHMAFVLPSAPTSKFSDVNYHSQYQLLHLPDPETQERMYAALLKSYSQRNANQQFHDRMIELLRGGNSEDISLWNINNAKELDAHDKLCKELIEQQQQRAPVPPSLWQQRRTAEQSRRPSVHYFGAISCSGTVCPTTIGISRTDPVVFPSLLPISSPLHIPHPSNFFPFPGIPYSHVQEPSSINNHDAMECDVATPGASSSSAVGQVASAAMECDSPAPSSSDRPRLSRGQGRQKHRKKKAASLASPSQHPDHAKT
jgi:hypothetical protein